MAATRVIPTARNAAIVTVSLLSVSFDAMTPDAREQAPGPKCRYEENCECPVPGITVRWKAAVCMAREQTDDFEHAGVQACLARPDPEAVRALTACTRNDYWKRELCVATRTARDVDDCVRDASFIPRIVERGAGG